VQCQPEGTSCDQEPAIRGPLGGVANLVTTSTGRRFRGWGVIVGIQYH